MASGQEFNSGIVEDKHSNADGINKEEGAIVIGITTNDEPPQVQQATLRAIIGNSTLGTNIQLLRHHDWYGSVLGAYPPAIKRDVRGGFTHRGAQGDPNGSKGALVYSGSNIKDGPTNCAWLLAWHVPGPGATIPNKIYVECGDVRKYPEDMKWEDIEPKLDASSSSSYYTDDDTGSLTSAEITTASNFSKASVVFDVVPT